MADDMSGVVPAGIDACRPDPDEPSLGRPELLASDLIALGPCLSPRGIAINDFIDNTPALITSAPTNDLNFNAIGLDVASERRIVNAIGEIAGSIVLDMA